MPYKNKKSCLCITHSRAKGVKAVVVLLATAASCSSKNIFGSNTNSNQ